MSITFTLIIQMIVFMILVGFTMKYIWPPITAALDARAKKIAEGLSAADKAKSELAVAHKRVEEQLSAARDDAAKRLADAERLGQQMIEEAKARASAEGGGSGWARCSRSPGSSRAAMRAPATSRPRGATPSVAAMPSPVFSMVSVDAASRVSISGTRRSRR